MTKLNLCVNGHKIVALVPEKLAERTGRDTDRVVWLLAPQGEECTVWFEKTKVEEYAKDAKGVIVCLPWAENDGFYINEALATVRDTLPRLSYEPNDNRMVGYADSAMRVLRFLFAHSEIFRTGVCVCPKAGDGLEALAAAACEHMKTAEKEPRMAIADTAGGEAAQIGAAINVSGAGAHVYPDRPVGGWELVDIELKNCLAHL